MALKPQLQPEPKLQPVMLLMKPAWAQAVAQLLPPLRAVKPRSPARHEHIVSCDWPKRRLTTGFDTGTY